jgi:hypothetical protein
VARVFKETLRLRSPATGGPQQQASGDRADSSHRGAQYILKAPEPRVDSLGP